jgi:hypothetical protein
VGVGVVGVLSVGVVGVVVVVVWRGGGGGRRRRRDHHFLCRLHGLHGRGGDDGRCYRRDGLRDNCGGAVTVIWPVVGLTVP